MKNFRYFLLFFAIINSYAQKKNTIPIINARPEKFDVALLSDEIKKNRKNKIYITDRENDFIVNDKTGSNLVHYSRSYKESYFSGYDYSINPLFGIYKEFYSNHILKTKGIYCWFGFKLGQWYHYDKKGKLVSIENTNEGWDFTYKMVLDYCRKNSISLERQSSGVRTQIRKFFPEGKSSNLWVISYNDKSKGVERILNLDSKNGKVVNEFEYDLPFIE